MDSHQAALLKTKEFVGDQPIVEVADHVPFGFREIPNRCNISVADFLQPSFTDATGVCVIHILLGCGITLDTFVEVINKATRLYDKTIVLEHNRDSLDWDWDSKFMVEDHCLKSCISYDEFDILVDLFGWRMVRKDVISGDRSPDRNFIVELRNVEPWNPLDKFDMLERLGVPIFSTGSQVPNFENFFDVYPGSAESQTKFMANQYAYKAVGPKSIDTLYANGGGFFSLNYIHMLKNVKDIIVFDLNPYTVEFGQTVFAMIKRCNSIDEFLDNYLMRGERLRMYIKNHPFYVGSSDLICKLMLNGIPCPEGLIIYGLRNCANDCTDKPGKLLITCNKDHFVDEATLNVGQDGWLKSDSTFRETKTILENTPVSFMYADIMDLEPTREDVLLASNIFSFIGYTKREKFNCLVIEG